MRTPRGVFLDLDGVIYEGHEAVPGAAEVVERLRGHRVPFRFVTNTTRRPVRAIVRRLQELGVSAEAPEILTAPRAAVRWLRSEGLRRVHPLLLEATWEDLDELELTDEDPDAVLVGDLADQWSRAHLDRAFRLLMDGARLVAVQKNRYSWGEEGLELDAGPFVAALEYATGLEAEVVGKPSVSFFRAAAEDLGLELSEVVMLGDDLRSDVGGAQRAGALGVLVRTGKYRPEDEEHEEIHPDQVLDSIADLPGLLLL